MNYFLTCVVIAPPSIANVIRICVVIVHLNVCHLAGTIFWTWWKEAESWLCLGTTELFWMPSVNPWRTRLNPLTKSNCIPRWKTCTYAWNDMALPTLWSMALHTQNAFHCFFWLRIFHWTYITIAAWFFFNFFCLQLHGSVICVHMHTIEASGKLIT